MKHAEALTVELIGTAATRFWDHVRKADGCWLWTACIMRKYGVYRRWRAHRVAYALTNGPIPAGSVVCHTCDTPTCCNPAHLVLGTQLDNIRDMDRKGRRVTPVGPRGPMPAFRNVCKNGHSLTGKGRIRLARGEYICEECYRASKSRTNKNYHAKRIARRSPTEEKQP